MYHYSSCGLSNVWLVNGYTERETPYGLSVSIPNLDDLHRIIGLGIISKAGKLSAEEVRFLRKEMGLSQKALAMTLHVQEITVRKWEKNGCRNGPAQLLIRTLYREYVGGDGKVRDLVNQLNALDREIQQTELHFKTDSNGWRRAA